MAFGGQCTEQPQINLQQSIDERRIWQPNLSNSSNQDRRSPACVGLGTRLEIAVPSGTAMVQTQTRSSCLIKAMQAMPSSRAVRI